MKTRTLLFRVLNLLVIFAMSFASPATALAAVWTDQADYRPGSVVTISGDNSDGAGYLAGETVHVDVSGPNFYAQSCEGVAGENGAWSCQVTLENSPLAEGEYIYTALGLTSGVTQSGTFADAAGDFSMDFVGAAPYSYNHLVGGGAFDDRTVGKHDDIVESLEAVDFACGDIVTYLTEITVDDTTRAGTDAPQTIELDYQFLMDTTGTSGVAIGDITYVAVNYPPIVDLIAGEDNIDQGNVDDGGSVATLIYENQTGPMFTPKSVLQGTVRVTDLERAEKVIVRVDVRLFCLSGSDPTGNLQGAITAGRLTFIRGDVPVTPPSAISVGNQTVPFLQFGDLHWPELVIQKTVTTEDGTCPGVESLEIDSGDTVKYCYAVTNPSNISNPPGANLYDVTSVLDDNRTPADPSDDFSVPLTGLTDIDGDGQMDDLAAGGAAYGEALVLVTTGGSGTFTNTGSVHGHTFPGDETLPLSDSDTASVVVTFVPMPSIDVEKYVSIDGGVSWEDADTAPGPNLVSGTDPQFKFVVTNTGNVELSSISLTDSDFDLSGCTVPASLAVSGSFDCVISAPWAAGQQTDTATAGGTYGGTSYTDTDDANYFGLAPALAITKTATEVSYSAVGDILHYTIVATNTGNTTLVATVTDPSVSDLVCEPANGSTLLPGEFLTCTATHTVTQADIDAGHWANQSCVDDGPLGAPQICDDEDVPGTKTPLLSITKAATENSYSAVGEILHYTIIATNIGNTTLAAVTVTDPSVSDLVCVPANGSALLPGEFLTCTATHTVTQADIDAGHWANQSCVDDGPLGAPGVCDDEDVPGVKTPHLTITKHAAEASFDSAGDILHYTIVATNDGNTTLAVVTVTDPLVSDLTCLPPNGSALLPGESLTCTATHTVTQVDIDAGHWANTSCVDDGPLGALEACDDEDVPGTRTPAVDVEKYVWDGAAFVDADAPNGPYLLGGADPVFRFVVTNVGNVTLGTVALTDMPAVASFYADQALTTPCVIPSGLAPLASFTCYASLPWAAGLQTDTAYAAVTYDGAEYSDSDPAFYFGAAPAIDIQKTPDTQTVIYGQTASFEIVVTNTGNVPLENVAVVDLLSPNCNTLIGSLPVGAMYPYFCSSEVVTESFTNVAVASGDYGGTTVSDNDDAAVVVDILPDISVLKTAYYMGVTPALVPEPGGEVTFVFVVTNHSSEPFILNSLTDTIFMDLNGQGDCSVPQTIAASGTYTCSITVTVTGDVLADHVNMVTAAGVDEQGNPDSASDDETVVFTNVPPTITVDKTALPLSLPEPGGMVTFTVVVTNTSFEPVTLTSLVDNVYGDLNGQGTCATGGVIFPAASYSCEFQGAVTGEPGFYTDIVTAVVTDNDGSTGTDDDDATVELTDVAPAIMVEKTADPTAVPENGAFVTFNFTVTNTGTVEPVTITSLEDDIFGVLVGDGDCMVSTVLPVGSSCQFSILRWIVGDYTGPDHVNVFTAVAVDNDGTTATDDDDAAVDFTDVAPDITITKTASPTQVPETGGDVTFTFLVENIGEEPVTLTELTDTVFGDLNGQGDCTLGAYILVGGSYSCSITVFLSSDTLAPHHNVATAVGTDEDGTTDTATDDETVTFADVAPLILLTKSAFPTNVPETGGDVTFTFLVENIGEEDITLTQLTDTVFGDLNGLGTCATGGTILIGSSYTCEYTVWLASDTLESHYNLSTATAVDDDNTPASDTDDETVTFDDVAPDITITKTAFPTHVPETGGDVTFTFVVENVGVEDVILTSLIDMVFGDLNGQGDCATGGTILIGGSYTCSITVFLSSDTLDAHHNVVTAVGTDDDGTTDSASDDETVTFDDVAPDITITKTANPTHVPENGGDVTFTFVVDNVGQEDVILTELSDTVFGDLNGLGTCATGGTILIGGSYTCEYTIWLASDTLTPHYNVTTAVGTDDDGTNDTATDDETVTFDDVMPTVTLNKSVTPASLPEPGGVFNYTLTITNTSVEAVTITALTDTNMLSTDCTALIGTSIPVGGFASCTYTVTNTEAGVYPNTADVTVEDNDGNQASDTDTETVSVTDVMPTVTLDKSVTPASLPEPGGVFTFTLTITNTSVEPVTITALTDTNALSTGCLALIGTSLPVGGSATCTYMVTHTDAGVFPNTAIVTVVDNEANSAEDTDTESVTVTDVMPVIMVEKTASPTSVPETGANVTFTFRVTNQSVEPVTITSLGDTDFTLTGDADCQVGTLLAVGGWCEFTQTELIAGDYELGPAHSNTFTAHAQDNETNDAWDDDDATVTFTDSTAQIDVEKLVSVDGGITWFDADTPFGPFAYYGDTVQFRFIVTNTGNTALSSITLTDTDFDLSGCSVPMTLAVGASFNCQISTPAVTGQHVNTATTSGSFTDGAGNLESDSDSDDAHYYGMMKGQPSIQINSLTAAWTTARTVLTGTFNITDESEGGNRPDGFLIALTEYQVDWDYAKKGTFEASDINGPSGGWLNINGKQVTYTCTYAIVDIDGDASFAKPLAPGEAVVFDESVNLSYTCTFSSAIPTAGYLRGTARAGIFGRTDMVFLYRKTFTLGKGGL